MLLCFTQIQLDGLFLDVITLACIVRACGNLKSIIIGQKIHIQILLAGYENDRFIASMLVHMYAKCEYLLDACMVFDKSKHDDISWNALITRLLDCGYSSHVGNCIEKMYLENISVDCGIYAAVLKACSSIYALDEGQKIHTEILLKGYEKDLFVGSSLVDLYAKCGAAHEAWIIFKGLFAQDMCYENMSMVRMH